MTDQERIKGMVEDLLAMAAKAEDARRLENQRYQYSSMRMNGEHHSRRAFAFASYRDDCRSFATELQGRETSWE